MKKTILCSAKETKAEDRRTVHLINYLIDIVELHFQRKCKHCLFPVFALCDPCLCNFFFLGCLKYNDALRVFECVYTLDFECFLVGDLGLRRGLAFQFFR